MSYDLEVIPTFQLFLDQVSDLTRRSYKTHEKYLTDSKTLAEAAKPRSLKKQPSGRIGNRHLSTTSVPFRGAMEYLSSTFVAIKTKPISLLMMTFLEDHAAMTPLEGNSYAIVTMQSIPSWSISPPGTTRQKLKYRDSNAPMTVERHSSVSSNITKVSAFITWTYVRRAKFLRVCSILVRSHHTCGGRSSKSALHEHSTPM